MLYNHKRFCGRINRMAKISIGADHGGYNLKEKIKAVLIKEGHKVIDMGTESAASCDYPVYGYKTALMVSKKKTQKGIVICKSGIGMSIVANKSFQHLYS